MSDLPTQGLLQQLKAHARSGEYLEVLGKKASADWGSGRYKTLTDAVTYTVKQAQLSPEQVKRVVEFANTAAFLTDFKKEGAPHHVVEFVGGPADASEILKDLNDGGGGAVTDYGSHDYSMPPSGAAAEKTASPHTETALAALFGGDGPEAMPYENPHAEVIDLRDKLAGAADHLQAQISGLEIAYADLADRVYHQVKQAALSGHSMGQVLQAWQAVAPTEEYIKVGFSLITPRLLREGVFHTIGEMTASVDKTAEASMVNPEHPLVVDFSEFCDALAKLAELRSARVEVRGHMNHLTAYLKTASTVGDVYRASKRLSGGAAEAVGPFARKHLGNTAGSALETATRYSPELLAAGALSEAHTHLKHDPRLQPLRTAGNLIARQVPGTTPYYQHQWEVQSGQ